MEAWDQRLPGSWWLWCFRRFDPKKLLAERRSDGSARACRICSPLDQLQHANELGRRSPNRARLPTGDGFRQHAPPEKLFPAIPPGMAVVLGGHHFRTGWRPCHHPALANGPERNRNCALPGSPPTVAKVKDVVGGGRDRPGAAVSLRPSRRKGRWQSPAMPGHYARDQLAARGGPSLASATPGELGIGGAFVLALRIRPAQPTSVGRLGAATKPPVDFRTSPADSARRQLHRRRESYTPWPPLRRCRARLSLLRQLEPPADHTRSGVFFSVAG